MNWKYIFICLLSPFLAMGQGPSKVSLNGAWSFALDPLNVGERGGWHKEGFSLYTFDQVEVPHSFSVDKRYFFYTGTAWYFRSFNSPAIPKGYRSFLRFDAVFYKAKVWLNGQEAGAHEGGYTPFEVEVTQLLKEKNTLAVQVNNAWDTTTIPGAKTSDIPDRPNMGQLYAWMNYGGITRPVQLITRPDPFVRNIKITAEPDLKKGNARIQIRAFISAAVEKPALKVNIYQQGTKYDVRFKQTASGSTGEVTLEGTLSSAKYWSQDAPDLYEAEVILGADTLRRNFGIRKLEIKGTQLLLNGEPIRMGGCNRPLDYPGYGSLDPASVLKEDLTLIKDGSMELSRISHYPVSEQLLDWADKHGLLIIEEAGNWQLRPRQMADPMMRAKYQAQAKEMIERDWNHPCVIAYSLGNEFQSQTPEGIAWVKDMRAYTRSLDSTRFITFASYIVWRDFIKHPEEEASQYVDFISANIYGNHLALLQHTHELYPNKPIYVSEFGVRMPADGKEEVQMNYFRKALQDLRRCDYVIGASVWSFNDYMSRFPGTDANGYRSWGLVSPERKLRGAYYVWQEEFAPATVELVKQANGQATVKVTARADFPSYTLRNYQLRCGNNSWALKTLRPGESQQLDITYNGGDVELVKPGGFVILKKALTK